MYLNKCTACGASLDAGEKCDCNGKASNRTVNTPPAGKAHFKIKGLTYCRCTCGSTKLSVVADAHLKRLFRLKCDKCGRMSNMACAASDISVHRIDWNRYIAKIKREGKARKAG